MAAPLCDHASPSAADDEAGSRDARPDGPRVVWQVVDGEADLHERLLRQAANLLADLQPDAVQIEVVAHGAGLDLLLAPGRIADLVRELQEAGVVFVACDNTLRSRGLTLADLVGGVRATPSGVGHLVRRQQAGWSYLRA
jgi:uncharacterized protein